MGGTDHEHEQRRWRHAAAHEHAAVVHDRAAMAHRQAAEFFDEHGEPGKADRERQLADREAQKAEAARREASAGLEELPPDCRSCVRHNSGCLEVLAALERRSAGRHLLASGKIA